MNELKIKLLTPTAKVPVRAHAYDSGLDLFSDEDVVLWRGADVALVETGVAVEVPPGFQATILPRSSMSARGIHTFTGTIDSGFVGPIKVGLLALVAGAPCLSLPRGSKIAQLVITRVELPTVRVVDELEQHGTRGANGWGSTGNR